MFFLKGMGVMGRIGLMGLIERKRKRKRNRKRKGMENNIMRENKYFCRKTRNNNHNINYLHMKTRKKLLLLLLVGMM